ncbi:MAG: ABC transporter permease, partial [Spirochaetales bacterium]|nr:ABC transporter permease [Spirochaetales bacterium]
MNVTKIAVRNITRQKKRSILLGGAIAFGVMIITLIGSFTKGVTDTASANFTDMLGGQIYITGQELTATGGQVSVVRDKEVLDEALAHGGARIAEKTYRSRTIGEIIFGSMSAPVSVEGVDWSDEPELIDSLDVKEGSISATMAADSIILPEYTAKDIGVQVGETVLVRTSTVTGQQNVGEFKVRAITKADSMFSFSSAYADKSFLNGLIGLDAEDYQVLNISLANPVTADAVTANLVSYLRSIGRMEPEKEQETGIAGMRSRMMGMASLMGGGSLFSSKVEDADRWEGTRFNVLNLSDMMEAVTSMVNVLNTVSYVIFIVLLVITMVGLLNTFRMVLIERTREIGTLRAIGMQRTEVRNIFLTEALVLALGGALAGLIVATVLSAILGVIPFPTDSPLQLFLIDSTFAFPIVPSNILMTLLIIT